MPAAGLLLRGLVALLCLTVLAARRLPREATQHHHGDEGSGNHGSNGAAHRDHHRFFYARPDEWAVKFPVCGGTRQSPINIELQDVKTVDLGRPPLGRFGYDTRPLEMTVTNNGHTVQVTGTWPEHDTPTIYGGPLTGLYELAQVHFHWGPTNDVGSEHTVANHSFPLEMHMVHWKKAYHNLSEALKHDDGLAVVGYIMSLDKNANMGIERIRPEFPNILKPGQSAKIDPFPISLFDLDLLKEGYVTYLGSLTTPPCSESIIWLLSVRIKDVTIDELESFRKLHLNHNENMNYRPTQAINGRQIFFLHENPIQPK